MEEKTGLGDIQYRNLLAAVYRDKVEEKTIERRMAWLNGFVSGMMVMSIVIFGAAVWLVAAL